jgi:hypothetical protein
LDAAPDGALEFCGQPPQGGTLGKDCRAIIQLHHDQRQR